MLKSVFGGYLVVSTFGAVGSISTTSYPGPGARTCDNDRQPGPEWQSSWSLSATAQMHGVPLNGYNVSEACRQYFGWVIEWMIMRERTVLVKCYFRHDGRRVASFPFAEPRWRSPDFRTTRVRSTVSADRIRGRKIVEWRRPFGLQPQPVVWFFAQ